MIQKRIPTSIVKAGNRTVEAYLAFFAQYQNPGTRSLYRLHLERFFRWAEAQELSLGRIYAFDATVYSDELSRCLAPASVALYCATLRRFFERLKDMGLVAENPFDFTSPGMPIADGSIASVEWQAVMDAAELSLTLDSLGQYGLMEGVPPVNQRLCEEVLALGRSRGIVPAEDVWERFRAALQESGVGEGAGETATDKQDPAGGDGTAEAQVAGGSHGR